MKAMKGPRRGRSHGAAWHWAWLLVLAWCLGGGPAWAQGPVQVIAHRGFTLHHPENSLGALRAAMGLGLDGAEIDLHTTKDGRVVLMHDADLDRTSLCHGPVAAMTWDQVAQCRLKTRDGQPTSEKVPSLEQALELVKTRPGFSLTLDLKGADLAAVADLAAAGGQEEQVHINVPQPERVDMVRLVRGRHPGMPVCMDLRWWWKIEGLPAFVARALDVEYLFAMEWSASPAGFAAARQAGAQVVMYLWGLRDLPQRARRALDMGATVISCDRPDLILPVVRGGGGGGGGGGQGRQGGPAPRPAQGN